MSRIQVAASGRGECARAAKFSRAGCEEMAVEIESIAETQTTPITSCCLASALCCNGCETGALVPFETAQHVLFAQQCILQRCSLGAFERMHEAAGNCSGRVASASTMASRIGALFRMKSI